MSDLVTPTQFEPLPFDPIEPPPQRDTATKSRVTSEERDRIAKVVDLYQDKLERLEAEKGEAYDFAMHILSTFTLPEGETLHYMGGQWNAELEFERALIETGKRTAYKFKRRTVDPKYLVGGAK